jgi:hypothetical protein
VKRTAIADRFDDLISDVYAPVRAP